jgi:CheY-like chemotaxis protein
VPLADAVARGLRREGMAVDVAHDGETGLEKAMMTRYDVLVLDRDLPGRSGDDVCRRMADEGSVTRILMLTAAGGVADRVAGSSSGPTTTSPSPSPSPSWSPACAPSAGARRRPRPPSCAAPEGSSSTRPAVPSPAAEASST